MSIKRQSKAVKTKSLKERAEERLETEQQDKRLSEAMKIKIRKYRKSDRDAIIRLYKEFEDYLTATDPLKRIVYKPEFADYYLKENLTNVSKKNGAFYIAEVDNKIVGLVVAIIPKPDKGDKLSTHPKKPQRRGFIEELYVASAHRGKSIGEQLMKAAEQYLKKNGCDLFTLSVFTHNIKARRFYEKIGYLDRSIDMIKELKR